MDIFLPFLFLLLPFFTLPTPISIQINLNNRRSNPDPPFLSGFICAPRQDLAFYDIFFSYSINIDLAVGLPIVDSAVSVAVGLGLRFQAGVEEVCFISGSEGVSLEFEGEIIFLVSFVDVKDVLLVVF